MSFTSTKRLSVNEIARIAHESVRAFKESQGDTSSPPWETAPRYQQESMIEGVRRTLDAPSWTPRDQHNAWCEYKRRQGWRWGPEKDAGEKTHPCLVPFDDLPQAEQAKDVLWMGVVRALEPLLDTA